MAGRRRTMGDFSHSFDIILFALVAVFLVLRLRSVLGRRTVHERNSASGTLETRIAQIKSLDIVEAGLDGRMARVRLKLVSDQLNVLRAHDGSVVDGDPNHPIEKTDFWIFARDTGSSDPNWVLVATASG